MGTPGPSLEQPHLKDTKEACLWHHYRVRATAPVLSSQTWQISQARSTCGQSARTDPNRRDSRQAQELFKQDFPVLGSGASGVHEPSEIVCKTMCPPKCALSMKDFLFSTDSQESWCLQMLESPDLPPLPPLPLIFTEHLVHASQVSGGRNLKSNTSPSLLDPVLYCLEHIIM